MTLHKPTIYFYSKERCPLCGEAREVLEMLCNEQKLTYKEIDIYSDDELLERYQLMIPVVEIDGEIAAAGRVSLMDIEQKLLPLLKEK